MQVRIKKCQRDDIINPGDLIPGILILVRSIEPDNRTVRAVLLLKALI